MGALLGSRILWSFTGSIVNPFLSLYIIALGGGPEIIGLVNSIGSLGGLLLFPVGGYIADKKGRARFVSFGTIGYAISFAVLAFAHDWTMVAVGLFLQQLFLFYSPALTAITADSMPKRMRGMGYALFVSVPSAIGIISPYIGGYLISLYDVVYANRIGYMISVGLGLIVAAIRMKFLKETLGASDEQVPLRNIALLFKNSFQALLSSLRYLINGLGTYVLISALIAFAVAISGPFMVVYATQIIGLTTYEWGILLLIGGSIQTLISFPIGRYIDSHGCRTTMLVANIINCASNIAFIFCKDYTQTTIVYVAFVIGHALIFISSSAFLANNIPRNMRGRTSAILGQGIMTNSLKAGFSSGFLPFAAMFIGSLVGGKVYSMNPAYPYILFPIISIISAILCITKIRDPKKAEE
jgi:MFS family permease